MSELCSTVPGNVPGAVALSSRCQMATDILEKRPRPELGELGRQLLQNEARILARLNGKLAPKLISFEEGADMVLRRQFIAGQRLLDADKVSWPNLLADFELKLAEVHALGFVHGDLRPENLIVTDAGVVAIDWEHALPIGAEISGLTFRATTLGFSDPRLIWARGQVDGNLDKYSISKMRGAKIPPESGFEPLTF